MKKKLQLKIILPAPNIDLLCTCLISHGFQSDIWQTKLDYYLSATYCTFKDDFMNWHVHFPLWQKMGQATFNEIRKNKKLPEQIYKKHKQYGKSLFNYCNQIQQTDLSELTNRQISIILRKIFKGIYDICSWGVIIVVTDFENNYLSGWLENQINQQVKKQRYKKSTQQALNTLITPIESTYSSLELKSLLKIASQSRIKANRIIAHWRKYCWLDYGYLGPARDLAYFQQRLKKMKKSRKKPVTVLAELAEEKEQLRKKQNSIAKKLHLDPETRYLLKTARLFMFLKAYRQEIEHKSIYTIDLLFRELSKRTGISLKQWHYLTPQEVLDSVEGKEIDINQINKRINNFFTYTYIKKKSKFYYGSEAKKLFKGKLLEEKIDYSLSEFSGTSAFLGKVRSKVKIVNFPWEMAKVKQGDILVSIATNPAIVPAMEKAAAFVTDTGGITCHAAIVAREMKKPCIIGTKIATKVLKDGDLIEVDADKGIIRKVK